MGAREYGEIRLLTKQSGCEGTVALIFAVGLVGFASGDEYPIYGCNGVGGCWGGVVRRGM